MYILNTISFKQTDVAELPTGRFIKRNSEDWSIKIVDFCGKQEEKQMTKLQLEEEMSMEFIGENVELSVYDKIATIPEYDYESNQWINMETIVQWEGSEGLLLQVDPNNRANLSDS